MGNHSIRRGLAQPKRGWLRFSLRTLLILTALVAVWLGVQVNKAQKQRAAVAAIKAAGGHAVQLQYHGWRGIAAKYLGRDLLYDNYSIALPAGAIDSRLDKHIQSLPNSVFFFMNPDKLRAFQNRFPKHRVSWMFD